MLSIEFLPRGDKSTTDLATGSEYVSSMGRGSVGRDILCFLAEELLVLGSVATPPLSLGFELLRVNHLVGRVKNWVKPPDDGELARGNPSKLEDS